MISLNRIKLFAGLLLANIGIAQTSYYKTYQWEKQPTIYMPENVDKTEDLVLVKDITVLEAAYDKDGQAIMYETHHRIYHVNTAKGVESVNKVFIPLGSVNEELDLKARCVTASNKIIPFNSDNIKRVDNYNNEGPFTIFTIDGVEPNSDVEYMYTNKRNFFSYSNYKINCTIPIKFYSYTLISPKNLIFENKSYNGLNEFVKDTTEKEKNILKLTQQNIAEEEEEKYSSYVANKKGFIFQLAYNTDKSNAKFYTWETIAKTYYNAVYNLEKNEIKLVEKLLDKNKISKQPTTEDKIRSLENVIKLQYAVVKNNGGLSFEKAIDNKNLSELQALKIYVQSFKTLNIPFEMVLTTDRMNLKFDSKFPSEIYMNDIMFYFSDINKYTSPLSILSRVGFPDPGNTCSEGVFLKEINMSDVLLPSSKIKQISYPDYMKSYHNTQVKVNCNFDKLVTSLKIEQNLLGYSAYYIQPVYELLNADQKAEVNKNYYVLNNETNVKNLNVKNTNIDAIYTQPMNVTLDIESNTILENAGNKYILKVGELIGPQAELYQEKKRQSNAEIQYAHYFKRTIEVNIPSGFKAINLEELKINKTCLIDGKESAQFKSEYRIDGSKIIIDVYEDYREIHYPIAVYNQFKDVINAAADFNKKTIVFSEN